MRFRGYLFFISMLFFVLFSTSFVCASEITQDNTSEIIALSDDVGSVDYGQSCSINSNSVDQSSDSILGLANNGQNTNEFENDSTYNEEPEQLRLSIDKEPILGAYDRHLSGGEVSAIRDAILDISANGGGTLYLDGGTYTGTSKILAGSYDESAGDRWWDGDPTSRPDKVYISNVRIYGGYQLGDGIMANVGDGWDYALTFGVKNSKSPLIPESNNTKRGYYSNYGCILTNITFENLNTTRVVNFVSGSLTNCSINNCISKNQFMGMVGCYWDNTPISVKNCNFTNCHQTNPGEDYVKDGSGQLGAVFGIAMENCNFVNTSSAQHGGALCIADESDWGSGAVASKLKNCNFINITSRWFAIYIHGNFSSSFGWIDEPEIIDGCYFLNCTGTGEYSGAIGISHDNLIVRNSEFINCSGGQGAAIMVGGLDGDHDGFSGRNYKGNNVTLENCIFTDNFATLNKTSSHCNGIYRWGDEDKDPTKYEYYSKRGEDDYYRNDTGDYYRKHPDRTFVPSGNAGAVFVEGNDTKIINCTFNRNEAESGSGAAVYITGQRTIVNNSKFYDHESVNGTVFIKGNNATFFNNTFINNIATNGASIYVVGANATILNSTFKENEADYGAGIYIIGNNVRVSGSNFEENFAYLSGAGIFIEGSDATVSNSNFTGNNATFYGAGIHIEGSNTTVSKSNFTDNDASFGAGAYINGNDSKFYASNFTDNDAALGAGAFIEGNRVIFSNNNIFDHNNAVSGAGVYVDGQNTKIENSNFTYNNATNGAGAYVDGQNTQVLNNIFDHNNVTHQGGAIYIDGSQSHFIGNNFTYNEAIPHDASEFSGLGGAIFVIGDNTVTLNNEFEHNKARNGSAIYSTGTNFKLENDVFRENQAWSYLLVTLAEPEVSYYNTNDVRIEVVHVGGDNMVNAIHNNASFNQIGLKNVTYIHSSGKTYRTNETRFEQPVDGVENSKDGTLLYQDDREYLQNITINVNYEGVNNTYNLHSAMPGYAGIFSNKPRNRGNGENNIVFNDSFLTNLYGDVYVTLPKEDLIVGDYKVTAAHPEDWNYKEITNTTRFRILPNVDLSVNKTSDKFEYFDDDIAIWTITVSNANNASNASDVVIDDLLPSEFEFINYTATLGSYNNHTGKWTIPLLANGTTATLTIYSLVESNVERMNHFVHIDSNEQNVILDVQRGSDKDSYLENDDATWIITVTNNGPVAAHNVNVTHLFPFEFEFREVTQITAGVYHSGVATGEWYIDSIESGQTVTLTLNTKATNNATVITNLIAADYKEKHLNLTVSKASDKEEYLADHIAEFTIKITNNQGCTATNVVLSDILQPEFEFNGTYTADKGDYDPVTNKWTIPVMDEGTTATLIIYSHTIILNGNVTNYAEVICNEHEWDYTNNVANRTVEVVSLPIPIKSVDNITPDYNDYVEYNLTIYNTGNTTYKKNLTVTDTLPDGLDFIDFVNIIGADIVNQTNSSGSSVEYIIDGRKVIWILTNIANKTSAVITVKLKVNGYGNLITNTTVINSIYNLANNTELINKLIDLTNNATFMKKLLDETGNSAFIRSLVNLTNAGATFNKLIELVNNDTYVKAIGDLTNETMRNELINLTKNSVGLNYIGNLTNSLTITGPNGTNITDTSTVYPRLVADLEIIKLSINRTARYGDVIYWNITVVNHGPNDAINVTVCDVIPDGLIAVEVNGTCIGTFDSDNLTWSGFDLASGANATLVIKTTVNTTNTTLVNKVNVTSDIYDPNLSNNNASNSTFIPPEADLEIIKVAFNETARYGDYIYWNVTVVNHGPDAAVNVVVDDVIPAGLIDVSAVGDYIGRFDDIKRIWSGFNLANGTNTTLVIRTKVNATNTTLVNKVNTSSDTYDPNMTNNNASNSTVIPPEADLEINKTVTNNGAHKGDFIYWTITVKNNGPDAAINVVVNDVIPKELINVTVDSISAGKFENNVWSGFNLTKDGQAVLVIRTTVNATNVTVVNKVNVSSDIYDPDMGNNNASNSTVIPPEADLEVIKVALNETARYGDYIYWNVTVVNHGPDAAVNVVVDDVIPEGLIDVSAVKGYIGSFDSVNYVWSGFSLASGANATIIIRTKVNATNTTLVNKVNTSSDTYDPNMTNNNASNSTVIPPEADLEINKTVTNDGAHKGDFIYWTITVKNNGPDAAINVVVNDVIPKELINVAVDSISAGKFENNVWSGFNLTKDGQAVLVIRTTVNATNVTVVNKVNVSSDIYDPDMGNNNASNSTVIPPEADLEVIKVALNETARYGDYIYWNVTVVNHGPDAAVNVVVDDVIPEGLIDVSAVKGYIGSFDSVNYVWSGFSLASGANATIIIRTKVNATNTTLVNKVNTSSDTYDPNMTNNNASNSTVIPPEADLEIIKGVTNDGAHKGDFIYWTITVKNNGPDAAVNVVVDDVIPKELINVGIIYKSSGEFVNNVWSGFNLINGGSAVLVIRTTVNATNVTVVNKVNTSSDIYDPDMGNNNASNSTVIPPEADLEVIKVALNETAHYGDYIYWNVTVVNHGPDAAINVVVDDVIPAGLIDVVVISKSAGIFDSDAGVWTGFSLASGANATIIIRTKVNATNTTLVNKVNTSSDTYDPNMTNNNASNSTVIPPEADLEIIKGVTNDGAHKGDFIYWTITVKNNGPDAAVNVVVDDVIPKELINVGIIYKSSGEFVNNVWSGFNLINGGSAVLVIRTTVNATNVTVVNKVNTSSDIYDPDMGNNNASNSTVIPPEADLEVIKVALNETAHYGDYIYWNVTVVNHGPDAAINVVVDDVIPAGLIDVVVISKSAGIFDSDAGVWTGFSLVSGANATLIIRTKVDTTNDTLVNRVNTSSDIYDPDLSNNDDIDSTVIPPEADLEINKTVTNDGAHKGDFIYWTITVKNNGPDAAVNVVVDDVIPKELINVAVVSIDVGKFENNVWSGFNLTKDGQAVLVIRTTVDATNVTVVNWVNVSSDIYDPDLSNNNASNSTVIPPEADLEVIKVALNETAHYGDYIYWNVTVVNHGPDAAINVVVDDVIPAGLIDVVVISKSAGIFDSDAGVWTGFSLASGANATLIIRTKVDTTNATLVNRVNVSSDTYDPNMTNNNASNSTVIPPEADLEINKTVTNNGAHKGDVISWTITVVNHGPDAAINVVVDDVIPKELINVIVDSISVGKFENNVWSGFNLGSNGFAILVINTTVDTTNVTVVNRVNVSSDIYDPDMSNNNASNSTFIPPEADLEIIKVALNETAHYGDYIYWNVTVVNHGPDAAVNVVVDDVIPKGLIDVIAVKGYIGSFDNIKYVWSGFNLASGANATLIIRTKVDTTNATLVNRVNVSSDTYDPNMTNNNASNSTVIPPEADLEINKTVTNNGAHKGDVISWTITVVNHGPDAAINVVVDDVIPKELINVIVDSISVGEFKNNVWSGFNLTNGGKAVLVINTTVNATNVTVVNRVNVSSDIYDPDMGNNNASNSTFIPPEADLEVIKVALNETAHYGDYIYWNVTVVNHGPDAAVNVVVDDVIPAGLIDVVVISKSAGIFDSDAGVWTGFSLVSGANATLIIRTKVDTTNDTLVNRVNVSSDIYDPNMTNNNASNSTVIPPEADLEINKTVTNNGAHKGDVISWTITVVNHGPDAAINVVVDDVIPKELINVIVDSISVGEFKNNVWSGFNLTNGGSAVLVINTTVNATNVTVVNRVNVSSDIYDPDLSNNNASNSTFIPPEADLEVIKVALNETAHYGDFIYWNVTVVNHGPDAAVNVVVDDVIPKGLIDVSAVKGYIGSFDNIKYVWSGFDLASGANATLIIRTKVDTTNDTLVNRVNTSSDIYDPNMTNNNASNSTVIPPEADLEINKTVTNDGAHKGDFIYWTITVKNNGPDDAVNVVVDDVIPKELINVAVVSIDVGKFENNVWSGFNLTKDGQAVLVIRTTVDATNVTVVNRVNVSSDIYDPDLSNNNASNSTFIPPEADLEINKTVINNGAHKGDFIYWTITVKNNGPDAAVNVVVDDVIPAGLIDVVVISKSAGIFDSDAGVWTGFSLASGANATLIIRTKVDTTNTTLVNRVNVSSDTYDPNITNNNASNSTVIPPEADLEITKFVYNDGAHKGDVISWAILVVNHGPDAAINVVVDDVIPKELVNVTIAYIGPGKFENNVWSGFNLSSNGFAILVINTIVDTTNATVVNRVNVSSDIYDPDLSNNNASNSTFIPPEADLEVIKVALNDTAHYGDYIYWNVTVVNHGPDAAVNVVVDDIIPKELVDVVVISKSAGIFDSDAGVWTGFSLASGANATLIIRTKVNATNTTLVNRVNVSSDTYDPDMTNNNASNSTIIPPEANLEIAKGVINYGAHKGDVISWVIVVVNHGPDAAVNVVVNDVIPKELTNVTVSIITDGVFENNVWSGFDLNSGEFAVLIFDTTVNATNTTIVNDVVVDSDTYDPDMSDNNASNSTVIPPEADLEVTKVALNETARYGDYIYWNVTVVNHGPDAALNVVVDDIIPEGLIDVSAVKGYIGSFDNIKYIWSGFNLAGGASATLIIRTKVNVTNDTLVNRVNVSSDTYDPDTTNNNASNSTVIPPEADLSIGKYVLNEDVHKGDFIYWAIVVTNNGPDVAVNVTVIDFLPSELIDVDVYVISNGTFSNGVWSGFDLNSTEFAVLVLKTRVNTTNATIVNDVVVDSDTYDPDMSNNNASNSTVIPPEADLAIVKVALNETAHKGDYVYWTIVVTNNGPDEAANVVVNDIIPEGLIDVAVVSKSAGIFDSDAGVWSGFSLTGGANATLVIRTKVNATNTALVNRVNVSSDTYDPDLSNNNASNSTVIPPEADLEINKYIINETAHKGDFIYWTIVVINHGPDAAVNVVVIDFLPSELTDVSVFNITHGSFSNGVWSGFDLNSDDIAVLVLKTRVNATNVTIVNDVVVDSDTYDPDTSDNNASNSTVIPPEADLEIIKIALNETARYGDYVYWNITVVNHGPDAAMNVEVRDIIPGGLIEVEAVGTGYIGTFDNKKYAWFGFSLASGASATLMIRAKVNITNTTLVNKVTVSSDTYDPDMSNNNASNSTFITTMADLSIVKLVSNETAHKGDIVYWTIVVTNNGPDEAVNVLVSDLVPGELVVVGSSVTDGVYDDGVWTGFSLASGASATLIIETRVSATNVTIVNNVVVVSDTYDPDMGDNNASNSTVIPPEADLVISKIVSDTSAVKGDVIEWTIIVTNNGEDTAVNAVVNDKLPDGLIYISDDSKGAYNPATGVWTIGDLNKGESAILTIVTKVDTTNKLIVNIANVSSETYDPNKENNIGKNSTFVSSEVDLALTIEPDVTKVTVGDNVVFTVTVVNNGPDTAINTCAYINLPYGLDLLGFEPSVGIFNPVSRIWYIGDLASGAKVTMLLKTKASISGILFVDAFALSDCHESDYSNNNDTAVVEVVEPVNPEPGNNTNPESPEDIPESSTMPAAGNPLVMILLSLLAIAGISLRRKN